jgi:hypothetical protein
VEVIKGLPPEASALPAKAQWKFWLLANRAQIGAVLLAVTGALGVSFTGEAAHRWLHALELLIVLGGGSAGGLAIGAAAFKSNDEHEQQMNRQIKQTTGSYPAVHPSRRAADGRPRR